MHNSSNENPSRRTLRPEEVEDSYGISSSQLQKMRMRGDGPKYCKPSHRMVLYRPTDIDTWLEQFRVASTSEGR
jgi:predicted DNA-binding transcriptional regulator AlpA